MSDANANTGTKETPPKTQAAPAAAAPKDDFITRLQALERDGKQLISDARLAIAHDLDAATRELDAAETRLQQFIHQFSLHAQKASKNK